MTYPLYVGSVATGDLDGDGLDDVVWSSGITEQAIRWCAMPGMTCAPRILALQIPDPTGVITADFDGDGDLDVAASSWTTNALYQYENLGGFGVTDVDGLANLAEQCITATDPGLDDTDGGGQDDLAELVALTDPLDPSDDVPPLDSDGDGTGDYLEWAAGTDPLAP